MSKEKFIEALQAALEIDERQIQMGDEFRNYPEWDSLAQLTMIAMLDEEFEVSIEMKMFNELKTVQDLFDAVQAVSGQN